MGVASSRSLESHGSSEIVKDEGCPQNFQRLPEHITGIDGQLEQVEAMLKDNRTVGLVGMGGLGKTTLAKAAFNKLCVCFKYTCFVQDVKLIAGTADTVKRQVLSNLHCWGKKVEEDDWGTLSGKEILLVLDDISGARDEEVLLFMVNRTSPKSRFIATSREQDSLQRLNVIYGVQPLNENSAESLFKTHAFPDQVLPVDLVDLTKAIVRKCEGLPLTLEVLGQYLKTTKDVEDWEQVLHSLDKAEAVSSINERLWEKLRPSYNALGEEEKQMFLDAATIFHGGFVYCDHSMGFSLREVKAAWREAYGVNARLMWKTLVERSLVYDVEEDDCIQMHKQLRSLGRKVAKEAYKDGRLCRVWDDTTALQTLQVTDDVDENIMDIHALRLPKDRHIAGPALRKLKHVRFLVTEDNIEIEGLEANGSFLSKLILLKCIGTQLLKLAVMNHLVVLYLVDDTIKVLPDSVGQLSALRFFHLGAGQIEILPDGIGNLSQLEVLHLYSCDHLKSLPETVGDLMRLKCLGFNGCKNLLALPDSFGNLRALEHLEFSYCRGLLSLPKSFGCLTALKELVFRCCVQLHALPESFGHLSALNHLEFNDCGALQSLPESFGHLSALNHLEFNDCGALQSLPQSFGHLSTLKYLRFEACFKLQSLPQSFGHLSALNDLQLKWSGKLQFLPESLRHRRQGFKVAERDHDEEALAMPQNELQYAANYIEPCLRRDELQPDRERHRVLDKVGLLAPRVYENADKRKVIAFGYEGFGRQRRQEDDAKDCDGIRVIDENDETPGLVDSPRRELLHRAKVRKLALGEDCTAEANHSSESGLHLGMVEMQQSHLSNDKVKAAQMLQDFLADVDDSNECGYFVSKVWLSGLGEHESEEVMSVLQNNRYLEIFDTETTVWYERMEENVQLLTLRDDLFRTPEEKNSSSEDTSQTLALVESGPALGKIQHIGFNTTKHDGDTIEAKNDQTGVPLLQATEKLKGIQLESGEASITTNDKLLSSLRKALKDSGRHSYYVSTKWLSSLSSGEMKELNSTLVEAGYSQTYKTSTTTHFERIRDHVLCPSTNHGETTSTSQNASIVSGVESTTGFQGNADSLLLQGLKFDNKGSPSVKVESTTSSKTNARCVCPPEILTVSVRQGLIGASSSNSQGGNCCPNPNRQKVGDCYATTPLEEGECIPTLLEKDISIKTGSFDETHFKEETFDFKVSAGTQLGCCLRRDHDNKKVHIDFQEVTGNINLGDSNRSHGMVLKSVRANVYACVCHRKKIPILLELKRDDSDYSWLRVLKRINSTDLIWLALSGKSPKNSPKPSKTLELGCDVPCRLAVDISTCSNNAIELSFVDTPSVLFEGVVNIDPEQNSRLELNLRYQVEISHVQPKLPLTPADQISHPGTRVVKVVDFDCVLELRTDTLRSD